MSATTHWFQCGCARTFVEHTKAGIEPKTARCPACGQPAARFSITETATRICTAAASAAKLASKRRAKV